MKHVSFSQYNIWASCPHHWRGKYVLELAESESNIYNVFGTAMHETVQEWLDIVFNGNMLKARTIDLDDSLKAYLIREFGESIVEQDGVKIFPCDKHTLMEFYDDGCAILKFLQENVEKYFPRMEWTLKGIEVPIDLIIRPNVQMRGFLDIVLRHKLTGMIKIIDLKTSTKGWNKWQKKDTTKTDQLLIYKRYYAEQYNVPEEHITVEFLILRRKLPEDFDWPVPRVSKFAPAHAGPLMKKAKVRFDEFLDSVFDDDGNYIDKEVTPTPSKSACIFCPFLGTPYCGVGVVNG